MLPGLRETEGGANEGRPEYWAAADTFGAIKRWITGHRDVRIPGSIDGNEFNKRFDQAVQSIYDGGDRQPVVFCYGAAIAAWTLMNVEDVRTGRRLTKTVKSPSAIVRYRLAQDRTAPRSRCGR